MKILFFGHSESYESFCQASKTKHRRRISTETVEWVPALQGGGSRQNERLLPNCRIRQLMGRGPGRGTLTVDGTPLGRELGFLVSSSCGDRAC